jgi:hypothetical protein
MFWSQTGRPDTGDSSHTTRNSCLLGSPGLKRRSRLARSTQSQLTRLLVTRNLASCFYLLCAAMSPGWAFGQHCLLSRTANRSHGTTTFEFRCLRSQSGVRTDFTAATAAQRRLQLSSTVAPNQPASIHPNVSTCVCNGCSNCIAIHM